MHDTSLFPTPPPLEETVVLDDAGTLENDATKVERKQPRVRTLVGAALIVASAIISFQITRALAEGALSPSRAHEQNREPKSISDLGTAKQQERVGPSDVVANEHALLEHDAVSALLGGRLDSAINLYRQLSNATPNSRAIRTVLEELTVAHQRCQQQNRIPCTVF